MGEPDRRSGRARSDAARGRHVPAAVSRRARDEARRDRGCGEGVPAEDERPVFADDELAAEGGRPRGAERPAAHRAARHVQSPRPPPWAADGILAPSGTTGAGRLRSVGRRSTIPLRRYRLAVTVPRRPFTEVAMSHAGIRNVVLVHGGFVDGSGWEGVYRALTKSGHSVTVVQNPTISLADDVAVTRRAIAALDGPVILVGHAYGGAVVTEAGTD